MKRAALRLTAATFGVPALIVLVGLVLRSAWSGRLPGEIPTHWGSDGADASAPLTALTVTSTVVTGVLALAATAFCLHALLRGRGMQRAFVVFATWLAALPTASMIATMWAVLDAPTWQDSSAGGTLVRIAVCSGAVILAALVAGASVPPQRAAEPPAGPTLGLAPGERATWVGGARMGAVTAAVFVVPFAVMVLLDVLTPVAPPVFAYVFVFAVCGIGALASARLRVRVDASGVTIRLGAFGLYRKHVPLSDIASAAESTMSVFALGGIGVRKHATTGDTAYKIRGGPVLELRLHDGRTLSLSVDHPEPAAALVNDLVDELAAV